MTRHGNMEMVQLNMLVPRGHAGLWHVICELDAIGPWSVSDIEERCNAGSARIRDYVLRLVRGGHAAPVPLKNHIPVYRLLRKPFDAPRLSRQGEALPEPQADKFWRAMKILRDFDAAELASVCGSSHHRAYAYLRALCDAGIIISGDGSANKRSTRFRLVKNLGAKAPVVGRSEIVFDPNARRIIGEPVVEVRP